MLERREDFDPGRVILYSSNDEAALREAAARFLLGGYIAKGDPLELSHKVAWVLRQRERRAGAVR